MNTDQRKGLGVFDWKNIMATPHRCPVCNGCGKIYTGEMNTAGRVSNPCHACLGSGVLWDCSNLTRYPYKYYKYIPERWNDWPCSPTEFGDNPNGPQITCGNTAWCVICGGQP